MRNRYHYCLVAQLAFKEIIQYHSEGMATGIYPEENFWAVAPEWMQTFESQRKARF